MYAYIRGKIVEKSNNYVVIENNGIGYRIFMTLTSIDKNFRRFRRNKNIYILSSKRG